MKRIVILMSVFVVFSCKEDALSKVDAKSEDVPLESYQSVMQQASEFEQTRNQQQPQVVIADDNKTNPDGKYPIIQFNKDLHDFGTIKAGEKVDYTFSFTNTGNADLLVSNAQASCGCTASDYTKQPIKPGKKGMLKVSFDSAGKPGLQQKTVTLTTNTANGNEIVTIKAFVEQDNNTNNNQEQ